MSGVESFPDRVARIAKEQNISTREAHRVATTMVRLEKRKAAATEGTKP